MSERPKRSPEELAAWHAEVAERKKAAAAKRAELDAERRRIFEKYGFMPWKKPTTPEEIEGKRRYRRDVSRKAKRARRRRKAEEARAATPAKKKAHEKGYWHEVYMRKIARQQQKWSAEQWDRWERRQAARECPPGSPQWLFREVVRHLAEVNGQAEDVVTARLVELGGMDFIVKGAESLGRRRCSSRRIVQTAVRALSLYLSPDTASMFGK